MRGGGGDPPVQTARVPSNVISPARSTRFMTARSRAVVMLAIPSQQLIPDFNGSDRLAIIADHVPDRVGEAELGANVKRDLLVEAAFCGV